MQMEHQLRTPVELPSSINSGVTGNGNSGNLNINTQNLSLSREGFISVLNAGQGNAGNININVKFLSIKDGSLMTKYGSRETM